MAIIQQSIEVRVPVHTAYNQLTQFEDYPRFMQDVETVRQLDDTHLHWEAKMSYQTMEWDAEITEQQPDRCIAWRNHGGPANSGRVEVQPLGDDQARITLTMECDPGQISSAQGGDGEAMMAQRLEQDLARFKEFIESQGTETGAWRGEVHGAQVTQRDRDAHSQADGGKPAMQAGAQTGRETGRSTQSDYSLSKSADEDSQDGRFSVAEEVSLDMQSDQARRVGEMPRDIDAPTAATDPADAMEQSMKQGGQDARPLKQSMDRAVPPSE